MSVSSVDAGQCPASMFTAEEALDEGMFDGTCVQCPWHDSVFDLRSGEVVHGPATYHLPAYDVRTTDGQIEIRVRQETAQ